MIVVKEDRPRRANVVIAPEYIPLCPIHGCDMHAYSHRTSLAYYHCPLEGCRCTDKVSRKRFIVDDGRNRSAT